MTDITPDTPKADIIDNRREQSALRLIRIKAHTQQFAQRGAAGALRILRHPVDHADGRAGLGRVAGWLGPGRHRRAGRQRPLYLATRGRARAAPLGRAQVAPSGIGWRPSLRPWRR